ncbi:hypothetical protein GVAV_003140 [Gurleya vavrai]
MVNALERLANERENIRKTRKYLFTANPEMLKNSLNLFCWRCSFPGPNVPLYANSYYEVILTFSKDYPIKPPKVRFLYPVFHPNVYTNGQVCLDILQNNWKPSMNIMQTLTAVQQLLTTPNDKSPANGPAVSAYRNKLEYTNKVRENIEEFHCYKKWYANLLYSSKI